MGRRTATHRTRTRERCRGRPCGLAYVRDHLVDARAVRGGRGLILIGGAFLIRAGEGVETCFAYLVIAGRRSSYIRLYIDASRNTPSKSPSGVRHGLCPWWTTLSEFIIYSIQYSVFSFRF